MHNITGEIKTHRLAIAEAIVRVSMPETIEAEKNKTIANADNGFDALSTRSELLAQTANVNVQCSRITKIAVAPNVIKQILTSRHAPRIFRQIC